MKLILLLTSLVAPSQGGLLIPESEFLTHNLVLDDKGEHCDDCCFPSGKLDHPVKFFGEKYDKFFACSNGLISFRNEVIDYTPSPFPIAEQPVVAAFWGDADLRVCDEDTGAHCSYWKVLYGKEAGLLNAKITRDYFTHPQTFEAKVAIVQTWNKVAYYDLGTGLFNTFQIVIVSDGFDNTFAGMYYEDLAWTTGDASFEDDDEGGHAGLGGTAAQMGFDAGNKKNFYSHDYSRSDNILKLANKDFLFAISNTVICGSGEELKSGKCVPMSCSVPSAFPIRDSKGLTPTRGDGLRNPEYKTPNNVVIGECKKFQDAKYIKTKVTSGSKCSLQCQYQQDEDKSTFLTFQPKDLGSEEKTNKGVAARCEAARWHDTAAQNCVEVGINYKVLGSGRLAVREAPDADTQTIEVSLKSKPFTSGNVVVEVQTSCKGGAKLKKDGEDFYCNDDASRPDAKTAPLAAFKFSSKTVYVTTLQFSAASWDTPQKLFIKGVDNKDKAKNGFENFKIILRVHSSDGEDCKSPGCAVKQPYASYKKVATIDGRLVDNEGLELKPVGIAVTSESGTTASFSINPVSASLSTAYVGDNLRCKSSNLAEGKLTGYRVGASTEIIPMTDGQAVTLTRDTVTFLVTGQPDDIVDGPQKFSVTCTLEKSSAVLLPFQITNMDVNVPGVIVNTTQSTQFTQAGKGDCDMSVDKRKHKMVDGCGKLRVSEEKESDTFTVKLATRPHADVVIAATQSNNKEVAIIPRRITFTSKNWNVPQTFTVKGTGFDLKNEGNVLSDIDIYVDTYSTEDVGSSTSQDGEVVHVYGYANCGGARDTKGDVKKNKKGKKSARRTLRSEPAVDRPLAAFDVERKATTIKCFSYDSTKLSGVNGAEAPDKNRLTLDVETGDDTVINIQQLSAAAVAAIGIIGSVVLVAALVSAFAIMAIKRKRAEEADRTCEMRTKADKAEHAIEFRMDEISVQDTEDPIAKWKAERGHLLDENAELSAEVGEEPMVFPETENGDLLVSQIKTLRFANERLHDLISEKKQSKPKKRAKKLNGFEPQRCSSNV